ncbi:peroxisomal membrane protein 11C [Bradysia coprophila]|uniref:peroxisomal membrane protein 11C n=1 Tax=Bradysia coprophila TaxID=38358 RepID=UPI00187DC9EE|nr:peroxisomal membrane protein 11C [Bradysia coprophila]
MMAKSDALTEICAMLDTYGGRDKVMKALCYAAKLMSGLYVSSNADKSKKFAIFSSKISGARATLRLIDDIPMLKYTLEYGWGQKEPDRAMSVLGVIANFVDHLYYPIEKICWLIEHKLLNVTNPTKWDTLSSVFWVSSIYLNLMRTMRMVALIEHHKQCVSSQKSDSSAAMEKLINNQRMEVISVIRLSLDLIQAGSTLPKGYLWGGKLETWHVGLVGTLSAFIGIYQYFAKKKMAK